MVRLNLEPNMAPAPSASDARQPDYWEQLYQSGQTRWDKGAPAPGLVDLLRSHAELPRGRVVVPGCGMGHDARAWAEAGFVVTGVDFAASAIRGARALTRATGVPVEFRQSDFLSDSPEAPFDWLFEHTLFCAIPPEARAAYAKAVLRWLRPGGQFLAVHYLLCGEECPPWSVSREEVEALFQPHFELLADWQPRSYPNRAGREWMYWWRRREG